MTTNDRVRQLRKELGLNQSDFGKKIGMKQTSVSTMEAQGATVSDQAIKAICNTFSVNETWLRTGQGEMFNTAKVDDAFSRLADQYELDYIGQEILRTYLQLDNTGRAAISRFAMMLTANIQKREQQLSEQAEEPTHPKKEVS